MMSHMSEQDLLLLSHRALGAFGYVRARVHLRNCPECRVRLGRLQGLSTTVASALRVGLPAWKPTGAGWPVRIKILLGVLAIALLGFGGRMVADAQAQASIAASEYKCVQHNGVPESPKHPARVQLPQ